MTGKSLNQRPSGSVNGRPSKSLNQRAPRTVVGQQPAAAPAQKTVTARPTQTAQTSNVSSPAAGDSVSNFVTVMRGMVEPFATIDDNVVTTNLKLAGGHGMSIDDRTISFECAEYLISNIAYIFMGLVLDASFKGAFMDALSVELQIDKQTDEVKKKTRDNMKDPKDYKSAGSIVLGLTTFTPVVEKEFMRKMTAGFEALDPYADEFDAEVAKLTYQQKAEFGMLFSNFMYLIRAFTHNDLFMSYVITVIEKVKATLKKA